MNSEKLLITVISDLHCKHSSSDKSNGISLNSTNLYTDSLRTDSTPKHPVHCLLQEIEKNSSKFSTDLLICPGDITDKIDIQGYITGWSFLEEIKEAIGANSLFATIGNHDVDSRRNVQGKLPFDICQSIKHNYPISNKDLQKDFWNDHFCIVEEENYILLIFNSAYSHISQNDAVRAKISEEIITKMNEKLKLIQGDKIKVALCHHHPINHSNVSYPDTDVIDKGEQFLELLNRHDFTIVIHGHKHEVKVRYSDDVVVFCAGSFSSLENIRETESDNVFHQIEIYKDKTGIIRTWVYGSRSGWMQKSGKKFPAICGFGYKGNLHVLAKSISDWFTTMSNGLNDLFDNLMKAVPEVQFLLPDQLHELETILSNNYEIELTYNSSGIPKNISKLVI